MRTFCPTLSALVLVFGPSAAAIESAAQNSGGAVPPPPETAAASVQHQPATSSEVGAEAVILPCIPVAAYWTGPPQTEGMPSGPELAILSTDIRPKNSRVHLDENFVGRARYLDGTPGYLYLAPGTYRLELRLDGYQSVPIDLVAEAGCRYDLKHRLSKIKGTPKEDKAETYGKGRPFNRVFAPQRTTGSTQVPDPGLRPDMGAPGAAKPAQAREGAAMRIQVTPESASIAIDGVFVATGREAMRMVGPLAVAPGSHRVQVSAPGHRTYSRDVELRDGQILEFAVKLEEGTRDSP